MLPQCCHFTQLFNRATFCFCSTPNHYVYFSFPTSFIWSSIHSSSYSLSNSPMHSPCLPNGMLLCPTYYIKHLFVQSFSPSLLLKALLSPSSYSKRLECFHFEIKWTSREKGSVHIRTEFKVGSCLHAGKCTVQKREANERNRINQKW